MQHPHIKLREIIWEITDNCNQNCSYCGSKDSLNKTPIDSYDIRQIISRIEAYPLEEINISGGNPMLVSLQDHKYLVDTLNAVGVTCKMIINPFNRKNDIESDSIISLYDWIGVSINNKAELDKIKTWSELSHITIITNFNVGNVFLFKEIETFIIENNLTWQIQYTMYDRGDQLAIYENSEAKSYLFSLMDQSKASICVADNMNDSSCSAGYSSLGILVDGSVLPCLSMRSWMNDEELNESIIGKLPEQTLKEIWVNRFADFRCDEFKCCKDHCNVNDEPKVIINTNAPSGFIQWIDLIKDVQTSPSSVPYIPIEQRTIMYGVQNPTMVYGVFNKDWNA